MPSTDMDNRVFKLQCHLSSIQRAILRNYSNIMLDSYHTQEFIRAARHCSKLQELQFDDEYTRHNPYIFKLSTIVSVTNSVSDECKELKQIGYQGRDYMNKTWFQRNGEKLFERCSRINKIRIWETYLTRSIRKP